MVKNGGRRSRKPVVGGTMPAVVNELEGLDVPFRMPFARAAVFFQPALGQARPALAVVGVDPVALASEAHSAGQKECDKTRNTYAWGGAEGVCLHVFPFFMTAATHVAMIGGHVRVVHHHLPRCLKRRIEDTRAGPVNGGLGPPSRAALRTTPVAAPAPAECPLAAPAASGMVTE